MPQSVAKWKLFSVNAWETIISASMVTEIQRIIFQGVNYLNSEQKNFISGRFDYQDSILASTILRLNINIIASLFSVALLEIVSYLTQVK